MKKSLFVAAIAAISLVACKKTEATSTEGTTDSAAATVADSAAVVSDSAAKVVDSAATTAVEATKDAAISKS